jgi:predicted enzyme related to lactoylglutathione lyase
MFKKVAFTMYPATDLKRARDFYEKTVGLTMTHNYDDQWVEYDLPGGGCFAITSMPVGMTPSTNAGGSIAFEVEDIEKLVADLMKKGVNFKVDIMTTPVCRLAVAVDSEGNAFTLHQLNRKS